MAEPQEYTIESFNPWIDRETGNAVKDPHGNIKGSVLFVEDKSEPIDATFKSMPNPGDKKFGIVDLYQTRAGSTRKGFKSAPRPQPGYNSTPVQAGQVAAGKYQRNDEHTQESIARSVALKAAVDIFPSLGYKPQQANQDYVTQVADVFLAWLQGSSESTSPKAQTTPQMTQAPGAQMDTTTTPSGYDKARAVAQNLRRDERDEDNEVRSLVETAAPVDYEEIPPEYR